MSVELVRLKVQFILYHKSLLIRKIIHCNEYSSIKKKKKKTVSDLQLKHELNKEHTYGYIALHHQHLNCMSSNSTNTMYPVMIVC